ncbi:MAG: hypothetical protein ACRD1L_03645 [Terriglobales bacterium]
MRATDGQVLDAIAAVVDSQPILRSEVEDAAWYAGLSAHLAGAGGAPVAPGGLSAEEKQTALNHLVDEQLLTESQADEGFGPPAAARLHAETQAQWEHVAELAGGEPALLALLPAFHLDRPTVTALIERQLALTAYLDQHFSGLPEAGAAAIQSYYDTVFVPAAKSRNLTPAPLGQVRATIAAILRQQQRAAAEQQWLTQLRAAAQVERRSPW